ncbi:MAG: hypothetical protein J6W00_10050 [Lentisphaeria bacterium]|nr:hypothetical protein [Lentisphaeria bacterium]MBO7329096.1 hypothetical protein [Lentisphaeria bacterium]
MESTELKNILWTDSESGKLIIHKKKPHLIKCFHCPCCKPRVIASCITNARTGPVEWDLRPYQKEGTGLPGAKWRLRDVGESHHVNPNLPCNGNQYGEGWINDKGVLVGLPDKFVSTYSYNGYMELQMGCVQEDGTIKWPCP